MKRMSEVFKQSVNAVMKVLTKYDQGSSLFDRRCHCEHRMSKLFTYHSRTSHNFIKIYFVFDLFDSDYEIERGVVHSSSRVTHKYLAQAKFTAQCWEQSQVFFIFFTMTLFSLFDEVINKSFLHILVSYLSLAFEEVPLVCSLLLTTNMLLLLFCLIMYFSSFHSF